MSQKLKKCNHSPNLLTYKGCMGCVGELAAAVVMARWGSIIETLPAKEREERAPEIACMMQEQVVAETERLLSDVSDA